MDNSRRFRGSQPGNRVKRAHAVWHPHRPVVNPGRAVSAHWVECSFLQRYLVIGVEPMECGQRHVHSLWEVSVQYGLGQVGREHLFYVLQDFPRLRHEVPINA